MASGLRKVLVCLLMVFANVLGVDNAFAAERTFLGNTRDGPLTASTDPHVVQIIGLLRQQAESRGAARVIAGIRVAFAAEGLLTAVGALQQRNEIAAMQSTVLGKLLSVAQKPETIKRFDTIPFMALEVTPAELEALVNLSEITSIEEDRPVATNLSQSVPLIGGTNAWASGFTGVGQTVAILDTGVEKTHAYLAGRVVSEACYSTNSVPDGAATICPGGVMSSTATNAAMPYLSAVCPAGKCDHGTHVAGIVAGNATTGSPGSAIAKDATLIAIQVFSKFNNATYCGASNPCALSYTSDQILGLQRVLALNGTYNIAAVNMSLGGGNFSSQATCDTSNSSIKSAIDNLRAVNIATVISSGNC